ncbi:DUF1015 family protein [Streptomyces sp. NPDC059063]|uniref:DUF1015 family protein n=1 Tax=unclassified Streptomyces TaxID=2593676 RepID=UPI00369EE21E
MFNAAPPGPAGLDLRPFRAVRYNPEHVGDLSGVICPPYDDLPPAHARSLRVRPHHVSRLLYADDPRAALGQLRRWLGRGVLRRDDTPALYLYEQRDDRQVVQRGLIGELRLPAAPLLPHEAVRPHEVRRHAALMAGLRAQLEPLLIACRPADRTLSDLADRLVRRPPHAVARTGRVTHRLWACTDPSAQQALVRGLAAGPALIADGHHRHAAARQLVDGDRPEFTGFFGGALALVVDTVAHPLRLTAIHRVLPGLDAAKAAVAAADVARVRRLPDGPRQPRPGELVLTGGGRAWAVTDIEPRALSEALAGQPEPWHRLPVAAADHLLIGRALAVPDLPGAIRHVHGVERAIAAVAPPDGGTALLLPPLGEPTVWEVAAQGVLLPRKSTAFGPKPASGLALRVAEAAAHR